MKILIAGDGKVGSKLAGQLSAAGHEITLIDKKHEVLAAGMEKHDVMGIVGNCASKETLQEAGVRDASLLIAATSADEINLLCCMTAHALNPKIHTIARIRNPEYTEQVYEMREVFGLSMAVNPEKQAATEIEHLLKYPGFLKRDPFVQGRVEIVELRVAADSRLCGVALCNMNALIKCRVLVCAVLRSGTVIMPGGDFVFREGDRLFVTAPTGDMTTLLKNLGIFTHKVRRVMICGGGRVSYYLAQQLLRSGQSAQLLMCAVRL